LERERAQVTGTKWLAVTGLGAGSSNPSKANNGVTIQRLRTDDFAVRVAARMPGLIGKENRGNYPSGNDKPVGLSA